MKMGDSTPICRCRVLYLGSAVPRQSKDGLQGIQEPLRSLYPSEGAIGAKGIDSWLSVWSNGILLENVDENRKQVTRFFPIESLHYCAAVRQVLIPERSSSSSMHPEPKFLPLDSPFARNPKAQHPPIFAAILRRTTGIKVLECHVFICKREAAANALVRCCFHAYADNSYAKQLEVNGSGSGGGGGGGGSGGGGGGSGSGSVYGTLGGKSNGNNNNHHINEQQWRSSRAGSTTTLNNVIDKHQHNNNNNSNNNNHHHHHHNNSSSNNSNGLNDAYTVKNLYASSADLDVVDDGEGSILYNFDENHKVWTGSQDKIDTIGSDMFCDLSSTIGRTPRARQISVPIRVPSPPKEEPHKSRKDKKKHQTDNNMYHHHQQQQQQQQQQHHQYLQQQQLGSYSQSLSNTLVRPKPIHAGTIMRGAPMHNAMMYGPVNHAPGPRQFHTFSHRGGGAGGYHAINSTGGGGGGGGGGINGPPQMMSLPMHPVQMSYMMTQQYATLQNPTNKRKKKDKHLQQIPVGLPIPPTLYTYPAAMQQQQQQLQQQQQQHQQQQQQQQHQSQLSSLEPKPLGMSNRKLAQSAAGGLNNIQKISGGGGAESPGGTGIYRRKGHLNERAFSYSIRQEHRSRSHGSLASLQFNPPDLKKEREIAQMVAGLDLNEDTNLNNIATVETFGKVRR